MFGYWFFYHWLVAFDIGDVFRYSGTISFDLRNLTLISLCKGLTIFSLGHGFVPLILSLATDFIHPGHTGLLYTALGVSETIGKLTHQPLRSASFHIGMSVGGIIIGLPFMVIGVILMIAGFNLSFVQFPRPANHLD